MKQNILIIFLSLLLTSCTTAIPRIYLHRADLNMDLNNPAYGISVFAFSKDGSLVITGDNAGATLLPVRERAATLRVWDVVQGKQIRQIKTDLREVLSISISPDRKYAIAGGLTGGFGGQALTFWDISTGKQVRTLKDMKGWVNCVSFSPDGKLFLATHHEKIHLFETSTGEIIKTFKSSNCTFCAQVAYVAAFSPDGKYILSGGSDDPVLRLWDIERGEEVRRFTAHKHGLGGMSVGFSGIVFSSDGRYALTSAVGDENVRLWDIGTGKEIRTFLMTNSLMLQYVWGVSLSPDNRSAFTLGVPPRLGTWDIATGEMRPLKFNPEKVMHIVATKRPASGAYNPNGKTIFLSTNDAALRVFDASAGEEIAMMVSFDDGEWIIITSEGYYNSSPKGHKYLSVKMGDKAYTVEQFYDVFYRPDIVMAKLRGEDTSGLIALTIDEAIKNPPPTVEFTSLPKDTSQSKIKVCYKAKSGGAGIGEIRLFHNGKLIESDGYYKEAAKTVTEKTQLAKLDSKAIYEDMRSVKIKEKAEISPVTTKSKGEVFNDCKEIDVVSGENEISITAFNKGNTVQSYMQTAKFNSTIKQEEPHLYILSIGIDQYKDSTVNLKYAVKDSKDIEERLIKQASTLYKPQNIHYELLTDSNATKANIINKITDLSKNIKPTDSFVLFVAGHGILLQNQYYMLTYEYDEKVNDQNMISSNEIVEMSKKIKSLSQLFIFDTCHAGGVDLIVSGLYDARMSVLAKKMGLHIYASASSLQGALDGYQGNGLFTYTLLDGLNNNRNADRNKDNRISLVELGEYSKQATTETSKKIGHSQTPLIINFGRDNPVYLLK